MPAGPEEGRIKDVGAVGAGEDDDARLCGKAVHLHQQLVERVFPLIVAARKAAAAPRAADRINLICARAASASQTDVLSHEQNQTLL